MRQHAAAGSVKVIKIGKSYPALTVDNLSDAASLTNYSGASSGATSHE